MHWPMLLEVPSSIAALCVSVFVRVCVRLSVGGWVANFMDLNKSC